MILLSWSTIIQLKFFPEHLARNQCPGDSSPAAVVKSLSATLSKNDKDHLICAACCLRFCFECYQRGRLPVHRCFSLYEMICGELFLLLLSCTESHPLLLQPVLRQCHWSFSLFDLGLMNHGLFIAALVAFQNAAPVADILKAAHWKLVNLFIDFYLQHVQCCWSLLYSAVLCSQPDLLCSCCMWF